MDGIARFSPQQYTIIHIMANEDKKYTAIFRAKV